MSTSDLIDSQQADGPHRPTVADLIARLGRYPSHLEVEAVAINGQTNTLFVQTYHEGLLQTHVSNCHCEPPQPTKEEM